MKSILQALAVVCLLALGSFAQGGQAYGDITATSSDCSTAGSCVTLNFPSDQTGSATIQLKGTFSQTITFEASNDNGSTWGSIQGSPVAGGAAVTTATATGRWRFSAGGLTNIRARCSAFTSGTASTVINSGRVSAGSGGGGGFTSGGASPDVVAESDGAGGLRDSPIITDNSVGFRVVEGAAPSGVASSDVFYADSTLHGWKMLNNNGSALQVMGSTGVTDNILCKFSSGNCANSSITDDGTKISSAEPIRLGDGSVSAPSYSFTTQTGTGLFYDTTTASHLEFTTGGTSTMSLFNNGFRIKAADFVGWSSSAATTGSLDTNLTRRTGGVVQVGTSAANSAGTLDLSTLNYRGLAQTYFVTSNFTTSGSGTALETITGLSWTFPANIAMNVRVDCNILYSQAVANVAVAFGFKDTTIAPTNLAGSGIQYTSATASTEGTLAASATTTSTNITSATPSATGTIWHAQLHLFIEQPSNASSSLFAIQTSTAAAADLVTVYRGSYCTLQQ